MGTEKQYITKEELGVHNKPGDLWISIQGKIYDVTQWANKHPGGDIPLFNLSGQDATDAFIAFHPGSAWTHLDRLFTGIQTTNDSERNLQFMKRSGQRKYKFKVCNKWKFFGDEFHQWFNTV